MIQVMGRTFADGFWYVKIWHISLMMHSGSNTFFVLPFLKGHEISESALTAFLVSMPQPLCPFNCVGTFEVYYLASVLSLKEA